MTALLGVVPSEPDPQCSCGVPPGQPHHITCATVAAQQQHAMVDDDGAVFYPDSAADAALFAAEHDARPLHPRAFPYPGQTS